MLNLFINFLSPVMRPDFRDPWLAGSRYWIRRVWGGCPVLRLGLPFWMKGNLKKQPTPF